MLYVRSLHAGEKQSAAIRRKQPIELGIIMAQFISSARTTTTTLVRVGAIAALSALIAAPVSAGSVFSITPTLTFPSDAGTMADQGTVTQDAQSITLN